MTTRQATVQLTTPDEMRGRALSLQTLAAQSANNIGTVEVGLMSSWIGSGSTMVVGGVISLGATLVIWRLMRGISSYRYPPDPERGHTRPP
jgi:predicted MFS family arabinose efflux permease